MYTHTHTHRKRERERERENNLRKITIQNNKKSLQYTLNIF